jgi:ABC-2 type transport system permease protein
MLAVFRTDWVKQWRRPLTYVALALIVIIPIIFAIALKANPPARPEDTHDVGDAFSYLATESGLYLGVSTLLMTSRFLLEVVVAIFAGTAIASEANWGNLRALLVRPIPRGRLLAAKLTTASLLGLIAAGLVLTTGVIAGVLAFGWHPLATAGLHQATEQILGNLALATLYVFWTLSSVIALGFMVSTLTDSASGAVFAALGLYIVSQILDAITSLGSIRYAFPTHYLDAWQHLFTGSGPTADMLRGALLPLAYVIPFLGFAWWWFRRKDILS